MWNLVAKIAKKIAHYGLVAFTGYEVGSSIDSKEKVTIIKEREIPQEILHNTQNTDIKTIAIILVCMVLVAVFFVCLKEVIKCALNINNTKVETVQMQQVSQTPTNTATCTREDEVKPSASARRL